jgi:DNA invertase Pin-like site-specific DNA recombinase
VDGVDTSTINGRLFLNLMASLAEYERELIREERMLDYSLQEQEVELEEDQGVFKRNNF